ncbi:hypothetical protein LSM04_006902 [Trypanosoma melophagium]|uniref:uncharacterized protein n=1 Tax=Trypanosoma melophagium TaxID=715481 RepID=UPI00351A50AB|nr:hypothetical protein LSM04_006902 [Trypanosoma melophagium]
MSPKIPSVVMTTIAGTESLGKPPPTVRHQTGIAPWLRASSWLHRRKRGGKRGETTPENRTVVSAKHSLSCDGCCYSAEMSCSDAHYNFCLHPRTRLSLTYTYTYAQGVVPTRGTRSPPQISPRSARSSTMRGGWRNVSQQQQ